MKDYKFYEKYIDDAYEWLLMLADNHIDKSDITDTFISCHLNDYLKDNTDLTDEEITLVINDVTALYGEVE